MPTLTLQKNYFVHLADIAVRTICSVSNSITAMTERFFSASMQLFSLTVIFIAVQGLQKSFSQTISINSRSQLVMNGSPFLVVNNASFKNDGSFSSATGTVKFSGYTDTSVSNVTGSSENIFYNLTTDKPAYGVSLKSVSKVKNILKVNNGHLFTYGNLTLLSDAARTARLDMVPAASIIQGNANVERYIPGRRSWRVLTGPVKNSSNIFDAWQNAGTYTAGRGLYVTGPSPTGASGNGLDASPQNNASMKTYDVSSQQFVNVVNTRVPLSAGTAGSADNTAYFIFVRGDRVLPNFYLPNFSNTTITSTGNLQTGTQTFQASSIAGKYTLVGNPYASSVNFNTLARANLVKRLIVWDPRLGSLGAWVTVDDIDGDGVYTKSIISSQASEYIQSSQGFFVETNSSGPASLTFNEIDKCGCSNNFIFRPAPRPGDLSSLRIHLYTKDANGSTQLIDGTMAEFKSTYSEAADRDDAMKMGNINENLSLARGKSFFAIERKQPVAEIDTLFMKLWKTTRRTYQFEFVPANLYSPGLEAFLEDSYLNKITAVDLSANTLVDFSIDGNAASADINRFKVLFRKAMQPLPVTVSSIKAYQQANNIMVEWLVENEIDIQRYDVEKSADGIVFSVFNTVHVPGSSNAVNRYAVMDDKIFKGNNFYRIKIYDSNGKISYTTAVKVTADKTGSVSWIYPNPVINNTIWLHMQNKVKGIYHVKLINADGKILYSKSIVNTGGNISSAIIPSAKLAAGIYQLQIIAPDKSHTVHQIIKE